MPKFCFFAQIFEPETLRRLGF